jgi:integrase
VKLFACTKRLPYKGCLIGEYRDELPVFEAGINLFPCVALYLRSDCSSSLLLLRSASELRGLRWQRYDGKTITVVQKVWGRHVGQPKTEARGGDVPVIPALQKILKVYRATFPPNGSDFIFRGEKQGFALNFDNLSRRTIAPILKGGWHGWHSFRRGLASRLILRGHGWYRRSCAMLIS